MITGVGSYSTAGILGIFSAVGGALAGLVGYQQFVLKQARKKKDETHSMETWETEAGEAAYRSVGKGRPLLLIFTPSICPASAIPSAPQNHGQHISMHSFCMNSLKT